MTIAHGDTHSDPLCSSYSRHLSGLKQATASLLLAATVVCMIGCSGDSGGSGGGTSSERAEVSGSAGAEPSTRARILNVDRAVRFHEADAAAESGLRGGLHAWGDLDGDGYDDVIVAFSRKSGVRPDLGWLEAWSPSTGERLWQVTGVGSRPSEDKKRLIAGYSIGEITKIGDVDGDGVADIYCQRRLKRTVLIYSGKSGDLLENRTKGDTPTFVTPVRAQDVDGDGIDDLWFVAHRPQRFVVEQALGGAHVRDLPLQWPGIEGGQSVKVALPEFTDANQDGIAEVLLYRSLPNPGGRVEQLEMAVLDGSTMQLLHKFPTPAPRVFGDTSFAAPGDVTGDGLPDIVKAVVCGAGEQGRTSHMQLIDGSSGNVVWKVTGDRAGGVQEFAIDMKTGEKTELPPDIQYGGPIQVIRDLNGDGVPELATVCQTKGGAAGALFVHSGREGQLLGTIAPQGDNVRLSDRTRTQSVILRRTKRGAPEIILTGRNKQGDAVLIVLELPKAM